MDPVDLMAWAFTAAVCALLFAVAAAAGALGWWLLTIAGLVAA